jgi:hypothetical protein
MVDNEINRKVTEILNEYYTDNVLNVNDKIGNEFYQNQLRLQKYIDKVVLFLQFHLISIWRKFWVNGKRAAREWECQSR